MTLRRCCIRRSPPPRLCDHCLAYCGFTCPGSRTEQEAELEALDWDRDGDPFERLRALG